jgi:hypothetical protein
LIEVKEFTYGRHGKVVAVLSRVKRKQMLHEHAIKGRAGISVAIIKNIAWMLSKPWMILEHFTIS